MLVLGFDALLVRLANTGEWNIVFWRGWLVMASIIVIMVIAESATTNTIVGGAIIVAAITVNTWLGLREARLNGRA